MRLWSSWSSGKDSAWALHILRGQNGGEGGTLAAGDTVGEAADGANKPAKPHYEVVGLLTSLNGDAERVAMHAVRRTLLRAQAAAVGLPVVEVDLPYPCDNATDEARMGAAFARARAEGVEGIASGDLFLEDVRDYRARWWNVVGSCLPTCFHGKPKVPLSRLRGGIWGIGGHEHADPGPTPCARTIGGRGVEDIGMVQERFAGQKGAGIHFAREGVGRPAPVGAGTVAQPTRVWADRVQRHPDGHPFNPLRQRPGWTVSMPRQVPMATRRFEDEVAPGTDHGRRIEGCGGGSKQRWMPLQPDKSLVPMGGVGDLGDSGHPTRPGGHTGRPKRSMKGTVGRRIERFHRAWAETNSQSAIPIPKESLDGKVVWDRVIWSQGVRRPQCRHRTRPAGRHPSQTIRPRQKRTRIHLSPQVHRPA